jgi:hypothetical protein
MYGKLNEPQQVQGVTGTSNTNLQPQTALSSGLHNFDGNIYAEPEYGEHVYEDPDAVKTGVVTSTGDGGYINVEA